MTFNLKLTFYKIAEVKNMFDVYIIVSYFKNRSLDILCFMILH